MLLTLAIATLTAASTPSCSPQKVCAFIESLNKSHSGDHLSLVCDPLEHCTISNSELGSPASPSLTGLSATVTMENVLIQNTRSRYGTFGVPLMVISPFGGVTGKNLTFFNTSTYEMTGGGCVLNLGSFACTDCVFDHCSAGLTGGGILSYDSGTLNLVRPKFTNSKCGTNTGVHYPCGSGCYCDASDGPSKCVGCTCKKAPAPYGGLYCDSS
jgi:hypothetical protein